MNHESISGFGNKNIYFFRNYSFPCKGGSKSRGKIFNEEDPMKILFVIYMKRFFPQTMCLVNSTMRKVHERLRGNQNSIV
jgi:hypothetical protein